MNALGWFVFAACNLASGCLGWQLRGLAADRDEYRREEQRDREWDEQHGISHDRP